MKYLPLEDITYKTKLSAEEVLHKIKEIVESKKTFRMKGVFGNKDHKSYEGVVDRNSFNITRIIQYKNSFLPNIEGHFEEGQNGTEIHVKMKLHIIVIVFMCIWCSITGIAFLGMLLSTMGEGNFEPAVFIPLAMLLFGYGMTTGGFKYESVKTKKYLAKLFEAEILEK